MRTPLVTIFEETLKRCLDNTLEATLGRPVRDEIYRVLGKRGIPDHLVSNMFDEVVQVLREAFGEAYHMLVHRTVVELYKEYAQRINFSYQESLRNHLSFLRDRVVSDHLYPRGWRSDPLDAFFDQPKRPANQGPL